MGKGRLEAFSDGVIAILITIMVLELHPPEGSDLEALRSLGPTLVAYVVSFMYVGIYWNNHHHLLHVAKVVNGRVLWANMFLLFWLSLIPFGTAWMRQTDFAVFPTAVYGGLLLCAALGYFSLVRTLIRAPGQSPTLAAALGSDWKGKVSLVIYVIGIALALVAPVAAFGLYALVALIWFVPDRRIERALDR